MKTALRHGSEQDEATEVARNNDLTKKKKGRAELPRGPSI